MVQLKNLRWKSREENVANWLELGNKWESLLSNSLARFSSELHCDLELLDPAQGTEFLLCEEVGSKHAGSRVPPSWRSRTRRSKHAGYRVPSSWRPRLIKSEHIIQVFPVWPSRRRSGSVASVTFSVVTSASTGSPAWWRRSSSWSFTPGGFSVSGLSEAWHFPWLPWFALRRGILIPRKNLFIWIRIVQIPVWIRFCLTKASTFMNWNRTIINIHHIITKRAITASLHVLIIIVQFIITCISSLAGVDTTKVVQWLKISSIWKRCSRPERKRKWQRKKRRAVNMAKKKTSCPWSGLFNFPFQNYLIPTRGVAPSWQSRSRV